MPLSCCVFTTPEQVFDKKLETTSKSKSTEGFQFFDIGSFDSKSQSSKEEKEQLAEIDYLPLLLNEDQCQIQAALNLGSPPIKYEVDEDFATNHDFSPYSHGHHEHPHQHLHRQYRHRRHYHRIEGKAGRYIKTKTANVESVVANGELARKARSFGRGAGLTYGGLGGKSKDFFYDGAQNAFNGGGNNRGANLEERWLQYNNDFLHDYQDSVPPAISWAVHLRVVWPCLFV